MRINSMVIMKLMSTKPGKIYNPFISFVFLAKFVWVLGATLTLFLQKQQQPPFNLFHSLDQILLTTFYVIAGF